MFGYIIVSVVGGILFGILDGAINANALAQRLYEVYKPIARTSHAGCVQWIMFNVPSGALLYSLVAGLGEMLILGVLYGMTLRPV